MSDAAVDRAGILAPPPVIYLGFLGIGLILEWLWPIQILRWELAAGLGVVALVCGTIALVSAIRSIRRAGSSLNPYKSATALVTDGLFRISRNPIYVSDTFIYVGLSLILDAIWALALTPALMWIMQVAVIAREEAYLERKFGAAYTRYRQQVRRWL